MGDNRSRAQEAVRENNQDKIRELFSNDISAGRKLRHYYLVREAIEHIHDINECKEMINFLLSINIDQDTEWYVYRTVIEKVDNIDDCEDLILFLKDKGFDNRGIDPERESSYVCDIAIRRGSIKLLRFLIDNGFKLESGWGDAVRANNIEMAKLLFELKCPWDISAFNAAVEHGSIELLEFLAEKIKNFELVKKHKDNKLTIMSAGGGGIYNINIDEQESSWGWSSYTAAVRRSEFERFKWVHNLGIKKIDSFWDTLLSNDDSFIKYSYKDFYSPDKVAERAKILEYCKENKIGLTGGTIGVAIKYDNHDFMEWLLDNNVPVNYATLHRALITDNLDLINRIYKIGTDQGNEMIHESLWNNTIGHCDQKTLDWLLEKDTPKDKHAVYNAIQNYATKERLQWTVDNGFPLGIGCYACLSNRYMNDDTEELCEWLYQNGCPLDIEIDSHIDINRPNAWELYEFIQKKRSEECKCKGLGCEECGYIAEDSE